MQVMPSTKPDLGGLSYNSCDGAICDVLLKVPREANCSTQQTTFHESRKGCTIR